MIEQLPPATQHENDWLSNVDPETMNETSFPLREVLQNSLYYPSSSFDGDPISSLAGNIVSFVYVDYGRSRNDFDAALSNPGFRGYQIVASRDVSEKELTPHGWNPSFPSQIDMNPSKYQSWMKAPFCSWNIMQRSDDMPDSHGPHRFSLLYLCADGVAAFQALYIANNVFPMAVAIIQPGHGFGMNWTNFEDPKQLLARTVLENPAGKPDFLLYGGYGRRRDFYLKPCWPDYPEQVCFLQKNGGR